MSQPLVHRGKTQTILWQSETFLHVWICEQDWRHIITCKSVDPILHRIELRTKVKKTMKVWRIPPDFWIAIEKGINYYAAHPLKIDKEYMPPEPQKPFGTMFYTPRNILQVALRKQSHVGWD
jgi:hypothetical protein